MDTEREREAACEVQMKAGNELFGYYSQGNTHLCIIYPQVVRIFTSAGAITPCVLAR